MAMVTLDIRLQLWCTPFLGDFAPCATCGQAATASRSFWGHAFYFVVVSVLPVPSKWQWNSTSIFQQPAAYSTSIFQQAFFNKLIVATVWRKRKRETDRWPWLHTPYLLLSYLRIKVRKPLRLIMPMVFTVSLLHIPLHLSTISYRSKNQGEHAVRYYPVDDLNFMLIMICSTYWSAVSGARWGQAVWPHWWPCTFQ